MATRLRGLARTSLLGYGANANANRNPVLRLVFTSDGVGVVIKSVERYDLVKIKATESETEQCFRL